MRRATIEDIAALAGVSTATVSKALNNKPDVSEATRAPVWEAARALNYQPNSLARGLVRRRSGTSASSSWTGTPKASPIPLPPK